mmetsp:Transcript_112768/g.318788  ORF Transcript_112768/g.318788 Transcript_112768/m.318788 type:complete len:586 (-) Transcript_112768:159-1916(-)
MQCRRGSSTSTAAVVLAAAFLPWVGRADLPVHCLRHQVAGDWEFTLGPLRPKRTSCGHSKPDNPYDQPGVALLGSSKNVVTRRFSLLDPNKVRSDDASELGTWTMIYDEGFEVASGNHVYFAFSKFDIVQNHRGGQRNISRCGETQLGWYRNVARTAWGCYMGRKVGVHSTSADSAEARRVASPPQAALRPEPPLDAETAATTGASEGIASTGDDKRPTGAKAAMEALGLDATVLPAEYTPWVPGSAGYDSPMRSDWQRSVAQALNFMQLGWMATAYDHKFQGKTPHELNQFAGVKRHRLPTHASVAAKSIASPVAAARKPREFSSFLGLGSRVQRRGERVRASLDWRDVDGQNWLQPVVQQGDCGSCYTISTVHMLTSRNRIRRGDTSEPAFSVSFPLYCSEYNQGCDGGYGFLQSKWAEDIGLIPESCAPFSEGGGACEVSPDCDLGSRRYRATAHHYVGGFYGGSDEALIREELTNNGPIVLSFEPKEDFMYYKEGIYQSAPNKIHQEWEQVDHAVLAVGYGVERGQPYWVLQNSWGNDWGEDGYFRMARGSDESGCESIAVAANVEEVSENPVLDDFLRSL